MTERERCPGPVKKVGQAHLVSGVDATKGDGSALEAAVTTLADQVVALQHGTVTTINL